MSILQYKYKAHKLVNIAFYLVIFLIGFVLGFGAKEIDFSKLLSQALMIDEVSAYTVYENDNVTINEEFIYDVFLEKFDDFDLEEYPYFVCTYSSGYNTTIPSYFHCMNFNEDSLENISLNSTSSTYYYFSIPSPVNYINWNYDSSTGNFVVSTASTYSNTATFSAYFSAGSYHYQSFTNFDFSFATDERNELFNKLDFSDYSINLEFNENLFKDNENFKEVCVEANKKFAIGATSIDVLDEEIDNYDVDYMWFPYQLIGLYSAHYDTMYDSNVSYYEDENGSEYHHYFNSKEEIDDKFDSLAFSYYKKGYTDKYSYYGWSAFGFDIWDQTDYTRFTFYWFENPITASDGSSGTQHGGGGTRLEVDKEIEIGNEYCFYIKNQYVVQYIQTDEFGDVYGVVDLPSGSKEFYTSHFKDNIQTGGLMSQVNKFINEIKDTINFIRENIYNFYLSMPLLLRIFLISIFVILIVKFIIGMVVK